MTFEEFLAARLDALLRYATVVPAEGKPTTVNGHPAAYQITRQGRNPRIWVLLAPHRLLDIQGDPDRGLILHDGKYGPITLDDEIRVASSVVLAEDPLAPLDSRS